MHVGTTHFAQVMEFVRWKTFARIVERLNGDAGVRTVDCAEMSRVMAFARLAWGGSLRDIYRSCRSRSSRKPRFPAPCSPIDRNPIHSSPITS